MENHTKVESVTETYGDPNWMLRDLRHCDKPSCFNGIVRFRRYRVTVEKIEEPTEVLLARLDALYQGATNYHHWDPLEQAANKLGFQLKKGKAPSVYVAPEPKKRRKEVSNG